MGIKDVFAEINLPNEQKWLSYCIRNPLSSFEVPLDYFLTSSIKLLLSGVQHLYKNSLKVTFDELSSYTQEKGVKILKGDIETIYNLYTDFANIHVVIQTLKNNYFNNTANVQILEDILVTTNKAGELDRDKVKSLLENLQKNIFEIEKVSSLKSSKDLAEGYERLLKEREKGTVQRSLGFKTLDKYVTRPAAPGEMTSIVALKGFGKSIFVKTIENLLINTEVPVISFNLEMTEESSMDRFMCLRGNFDLNFLQDKDKDERQLNSLRRVLNIFSKNDHYMYTDEADLCIADLDIYIQKAKIKFKEKGIMLLDDYCVIVIDLLEQVREFSEAKSPFQIKDAINKLHIMLKKHNCHAIIVLQANENKIREIRFKKPEDLDYYKIGLEDIYGGDAYAGRSRLVLSLQRPKKLKEMFFPERMDEWDLEEDIINCHCIKQNDGKLFFTKFVFGDNFSIFPYKETN